MAAAVADNELVYYYQPRISLITGRVCGAEALLRWVRPDGRVTPPSAFIPLAESSGYITRLGLAMFPRLIADLLIINDLYPELTTSFNLSAKDFLSRDMLELIQQAVAAHEIDPARLQAELTEASMLDHDQPAVRANLKALHASGVGLAMDDYGTGYSTIDVLSRWPFDIVKLDQGLIGRMADSERSTTIVQASIRMAHQLGITIVAEGIETAAVYEFLLHAGCTEAQGFWMAEPMPLEAYLDFLGSSHRWSGMPTGLIHMALLDHIHWRQALIAQVSCIAFHGCTTSPEIRSPAAELDPHRCKLGQWYYGAGREFRGNELFDQLEAPHNRLHELGARLLELARAGAPKTELIGCLRELTRQSSDVLELLQGLESEALIAPPARGHVGGLTGG